MTDYNNSNLALRCMAFMIPLVFLIGCSGNKQDYSNQKLFEKPESAVTALAKSLKDHDTKAFEEIFGTDAQDILYSGDPLADKMQSQVLSIALQEGWVLEELDQGVMELIVGHEKWPFPILLVKDNRGWWFDTAEGKNEILARRIGRNELAAIGVLRTYVAAQKEYAAQGHDFNPAGIYAQKIQSGTGKQDGLFWPLNSSEEKISPLGQFVAKAAVEGYSDESSEKAGQIPYHGYYFRILKKQGDQAPGGAMIYIDSNGNMTGGFAGIGYPAMYGNSGIMTFIVAQDGNIYESDLGEDTLKIASDISLYNPDKSWTQVW